SLEIEVPKSRDVTLKSSGHPYTTSVLPAGDRRVYRWKHANLTVPEGESGASTAPAANNKPADVNLTSFTDWSQLASWYANSADPDRISNEVRAKAAELTRG